MKKPFDDHYNTVTKIQLILTLIALGRSLNNMHPNFTTDEPIVSTTYAAVLCKLVERWDITQAHLLEGSGISKNLLENVEAFLNYKQYHYLIRRALTLTGEASLGLYFGQRLNISTHGLLGYAIMSSENLQKAAEIGMKYIAIRHRMITLDFKIDGDSAELHFDALLDDQDLYRFEIEAALSSLFCIWKFILGDDATVQTIAFNYHPANDTENYHDFFGQQVLFQQPTNHMVFPISAFQRNTPTTDPTLIKITEQQCESLLGKINKQDTLPKQVRSLLMKSPEKFLSQDSIAEQLNTTPRTLGRQLKKAGSSYQDILNDVRKELALQYLQSTNWSIDEIAYMLDYSDPSNFGRAFRRWTGIAPSQYRQEKKNAHNNTDKT